MDILRVVGVLATRDGGFVKYFRDGSVADSGTCAAKDYALTQPKDVPVLMGHDPDWQVGALRYLERGRHGLIAVADVHPGVRDTAGPLFFSGGTTGAATTYGRFVGARLSEVSLTSQPGSIGAHEVWFAVPQRSTGGWPSGLPRFLGDVLDRALRWTGDLTVQDGEPDDVGTLVADGPLARADDTGSVLLSQQRPLRRTFPTVFVRT